MELRPHPVRVLCTVMRPSLTDGYRPFYRFLYPVLVVIRFHVSPFGLVDVERILKTGTVPRLAGKFPRQLLPASYRLFGELGKSAAVLPRAHRGPKTRRLG